MNRYVVLGVTATGAARLANRRGHTPNEAVETAIEKSKRLRGDWQLILVSVGKDSGEVGDVLGVTTHLVREMPRPEWELVRI